MARDACFFQVPQRFQPAALVSERETRLDARLTPWEAVIRRYYDTADWRIHGTGWVLYEETIGQRRQLGWRDGASGRVLASYPDRGAPRFPAELPPGPGRQQLEAVVEMRALLPIAEVEGRMRSCDLLDRRGKLVARLIHEQWQGLAAEPGPGKRPSGGPGEEPGDKSRAGSTLARVQLIPVKGYEPVFDALKEKLETSKGAVASPDDLYDRALARAGRAPGDHSTKLNLELDRQQRSDLAMAEILATLLATLEATEAGTAADLDSEFLHDFRVAIRRARSALGEVKGALPKEPVGALRDELAWLGQATGPSRDLDVYLLDFDDYRDSLPPALRAELEPLRSFLRQRKEEEHRKLVALLESRRYGQLKKAWHALADPDRGAEGTAAQAGGRRAAEPIGSLAAKRIGKAWRRVLRKGRKISKGSPAEQLHELRKDCKKLRYLLEFFRSLFSPGETETLVKRLKALQDNLGTFQDCEVQAEQLRSFGQEMVETGIMQPGTQDALAHLIDALDARRLEVRKAFADRFKAFDSKSVDKRFAAVLDRSLPVPAQDDH